MAQTAPKQHRVGLLAALAAPGGLCLLLFFVVPICAIFFEASGDGGRGFGRLFATPEFWSGFVNSLVLSVIAGIVSVLVGVPVAWRLSRMAAGPRMMLQLIISLPLTFSGLIVAYGFILSFGRAGFVTLLLHHVFGVDPATFSQMVYSPYGLAFVYAYYLIPRVVMMVVPVCVNFDRNQLLAAESMGAGRARALRDVLLPQIMPAAISSLCLVMSVALGAYGTALALVGSNVNIMPLQLYNLVSDTGADFSQTAALALILTMICTLVISLSEVRNIVRQQ